jgi:Alpha/beta hydrolase domain
VAARGWLICLLPLWVGTTMAGINEVRLIPVTAQSQIFGAAQVVESPLSIDLAARGYVEEEYFVSGTANVYARDAQERRVVRTADVAYTTRIIVRRPRAARKFSGAVVFEPIHPQTAGTLAWAAMADYIMPMSRQGSAMIRRPAPAPGPGRRSPPT